MVISTCDKTGLVLLEGAVLELPMENAGSMEVGSAVEDGLGGEWNDDGEIVEYKALIEIGEAKERLYLLDAFRHIVASFFPFSDIFSPGDGFIM